MSTTEPSGLPVITIQDSFEDVINDVVSKTIQSEQIWVARRYSHDEDHQDLYKFNVTLKDGDLLFESSEAKIERLGDHRYSLSLGGEIYQLVAPKYKINTMKDDVTSIAVTKHNNKLIIGNSRGDLVQYDTSTQTKVLEIKEAHYSEISQLVVFPSDQVVLSVGRDFQAKLWSLDSNTKKASRTFLNQKKDISGVALVGAGRNFMTSSLDGSVNLWECGSGKVVSKFQRIDNLTDPATCLAICLDNAVVSDASVGGDLLFECEDKAVYVGYESGHIQQFGVAGHYQTNLKFKIDGGISSIAVSDGILVAGTANGEVHVWNLSTKEHHTLQLNKNFPVSNMHIEKSQNLTLVFVVSNGPDLLLRVSYSADSGTFDHKYLVGLRELFRVQLVSRKYQELFVATEEEIVVY